MKKTYMTPTMETTKIDLVQMIAASPETPSGTSIDGLGVNNDESEDDGHSRSSFSLWDD